MSDTQQAAIGIKSDAPTLRLTEAAVDRARRVTGRTNLDDVAEELGMTRLTFYRWRTGWNPKLADVLELSERLGWPVNRIFERMPDA